MKIPQRSDVVVINHLKSIDGAKKLINAKKNATKTEIKTIVEVKHLNKEEKWKRKSKGKGYLQPNDKIKKIIEKKLRHTLLIKNGNNCSTIQMDNKTFF